MSFSGTSLVLIALIGADTHNKPRWEKKSKMGDEIFDFMPLRSLLLKHRWSVERCAGARCVCAIVRHCERDWIRVTGPFHSTLNCFFTFPQALLESVQRTSQNSKSCSCQLKELCLPSSHQVLKFPGTMILIPVWTQINNAFFEASRSLKSKILSA